MAHAGWDAPLTAVLPSPRQFPSRTNDGKARASGFGAALAGSKNVDWKALSGKLPAGRDGASTARRKALFGKFDVNGNGYLSLAEVDKAIRDVLKSPALFASKPVVMRAFQAARRANGKADGHAGDYVERSEFRLLLSYLRSYFELYAAFNRLDTSDDRRLNIEEWREGVSLVRQWGIQLEPCGARGGRTLGSPRVCPHPATTFPPSRAARLPMTRPRAPVSPAGARQCNYRHRPDSLAAAVRSAGGLCWCAGTPSTRSSTVSTPITAVRSSSMNSPTGPSRASSISTMTMTMTAAALAAPVAAAAGLAAPVPVGGYPDRVRGCRPRGCVRHLYRSVWARGPRVHSPRRPARRGPRARASHRVRSAGAAAAAPIARARLWWTRRSWRSGSRRWRRWPMRPRRALRARHP